MLSRLHFHCRPLVKIFTFSLCRVPVGREIERAPADPACYYNYIILSATDLCKLPPDNFIFENMTVPENFPLLDEEARRRDGRHHPSGTELPGRRAGLHRQRRQQPAPTHLHRPAGGVRTSQRGREDAPRGPTPSSSPGSRVFCFRTFPKLRFVCKENRKKPKHGGMN